MLLNMPLSLTENVSYYRKVLAFLTHFVFP
nr:MAG TPA: hypothetical protein [Caudoviricetes sp.]